MGWITRRSDALVKALEQKQIAGAELNVTYPEPLPVCHPLWDMKNVITTHHMPGISPRRADFLMELFCENRKQYKAGPEMLSVVDKVKGY